MRALHPRHAQRSNHSPKNMTLFPNVSETASNSLRGKLSEDYQAGQTDRPVQEPSV